MARITLADFSGGLNSRDSVNALALHETPEATNWTLDERGALKFRKGCDALVALPGSGGEARIFYSAALDKWLCNVDSAVYVRPGDLSGSWTDITLTSLGSGAVAYIDFPGNPPRVVMVNSTGGVYTYDGTTDTRVSSTVLGTSIALWQNKAWVAGYPTSDANGNPTRLFYSAAGDPATWGATTQFVDLREKDAAALTALGVAGGALIAFKKRSAYRVNNAETGAFTGIDPAAGCLNPRAVVAFRGRLFTWAPDGIYEWDGVGPGVSVGDKVRPLIVTMRGDTAAHDDICGGPLEDRIVFFHPSVDVPGPGLIAGLLEYDPDQGWITRQELAINSPSANFGSLASKEGTLYGADATSDWLHELFTETPGADDIIVAGNPVSAVFAAGYRTPWIQPENGKLCVLERVELQALIDDAAASTTLKLRVYKDWDLSSYDEYDVSADVRGGDANDQQEVAVLRSLGHSRAFCFEFVAGTAAGEVTVRSLTLDTVPLER